MDGANLDSELSKLRIDKERKRARRNRGRRVWAVLAAAVVCAGGVLAYGKWSAPLTVTTARVEVETAGSGRGPALVTASGYVVPRHKVEVSSKIIGRIQDIRVKRGDTVRQGDVLLTIDDAEYRARLQAAEAQVEAIKARLAELETGSRPQEIAAAEAAVASSEASLRNAVLDLRRIEALERQGAIARQELDRARAARDMAQARLDADRKQAELVRIGPRRETIEAAQAQLRQAEANVEAAKTELDYTIIRAPMDGTILEKLAEQGELVTNMNFGGTRGAKNSVVSMANLGDLQVEVDLNESEISKVALGQKAEIRLDSVPDRVFDGEVDEISPQADRQKGAVQIKVRLTNPDSAVKTEFNARVTFLGEPPADAQGVEARPRLRVPRSAVVRTGPDPVVYVLSEGRAKAVPVKTGPEGENGVGIEEGLSGSEIVITGPMDKIADGAHVAVAEK
ncbi:MAG TPA: efflux RND transporter periplasmic adaptor subunit [Candidatus Hydrogenedentes bacterium]|nr:efflux RND transporter periplasmic adaptor subunit [Candidatus Hydrogenedentota bacterium]HOT49899.1 efflux RND transporter periplasmic adaptor subunit [Candidatus Hydrogenedentota bacterium]HOV74984.1 efflux RND transporter periplasmic adaptor subunit [Candidatus Hydrogenedentota bacterium]HPC16754.1 efflux RND transporter periplasmic adaptor subunit [Candidatus Hydrogenedentota bacterium]HRT21389.1 efflux RND transporter periplasmic adaptor subunit [Candidatus Hydrogenedentota bacterium]